MHSCPYVHASVPQLQAVVSVVPGGRLVGTPVPILFDAPWHCALMAVPLLTPPLLAELSAPLLVELSELASLPRLRQ